MESDGPTATAAHITGSPSASEPQLDAEEIANTLAIYDSNAEWIRFADAKAGAVLTVNGILASFLIPTLSELLRHKNQNGLLHWSAYALFGMWAVAMILASISAFRCIVPFRPRGQHPAVGLAPHFHSAATAGAFALNESVTFVNSFEALGPRGLHREILAALLVDAHIADNKYRHVRRSIRLLPLVALTGFSYLLVLQVILA